MALFAGASATSCKQIESRDLIREGNTAYNDGQYAEAIEAYTKSIEIEEDGVKVFWNRGCAALAVVLKLRGKSDPQQLEERKKYTNMALKDFHTWLDRAASEEAGGDKTEAVEGANGKEDERSNEELVADYRLVLLKADERCDDLLQYYMDRHKAEPRSEGWYIKLGAQYEECGQPEKRIEWMKKRTDDFPDSTDAWISMAADEFGPLYAEEGTGLPYNESMSADERIKVANRVIELADKATLVDPQALSPYTWRAMAYTQRRFARTVIDGAELPEERIEAILAREDTMMAWKNQKAKCDLEGTKECSDPLTEQDMEQGCCPRPPLTAAEQAEDAAAKKEIIAEMAAADAEAAEPTPKKRGRRNK